MAQLRVELGDCLAYRVLCDYETWLGVPSPSHLQTFLLGAATRAEIVGASIPSVRVFGPLGDPGFSRPLVARTGHPQLTIQWATALELIHFSLDEAMRELRALVERWADEHGLAHDDEPATGYGASSGTLETLLRRIARRPAMLLGSRSAWGLRCLLHGMDRGGDWLGLRPLPDLRPIIDGIERRSEAAYGSRFGAYRVYEEQPAELLAWVGIVPADDDASA